MSGSDSGYRGIINGTGGGADNCSSLAFESVLSSPKPDAVEQIEVGDILDIRLLQTGAIETVAVMHGSEVAGGLVDHADRIKRCIQQGYNYEAEVREVDGAKVTIFVRSI